MIVVVAPKEDVGEAHRCRRAFTMIAEVNIVSCGRSTEYLVPPVGDDEVADRQIDRFVVPWVGS